MTGLKRNEASALPLVETISTASVITLQETEITATALKLANLKVKISEDRIQIGAKKGGGHNLPLQSDFFAGYSMIADYLTIDCVEYSDAGSLPTLPRSST